MNPIANLTCIVVCGGQSSRMGRDKSMLTYYREPQRYHVARMLQTFCEEVYISLNASQEDDNEDYKIIRDNPAFENKGPMTALLSAYEKLTNRNLLFIGCDYPLLTEEELSLFLKSLTETTKTATFFNKSENLYEPLLAYYSADFKENVMDYFLQGNSSLQKLLFQSNAGKYVPVNGNTLKSVDSYEEFERVLIDIAQ